jgi:hypothetical protein
MEVLVVAASVEMLNKEQSSSPSEQVSSSHKSNCQNKELEHSPLSQGIHVEGFGDVEFVNGSKDFNSPPTLHGDGYAKKAVSSARKESRPPLAQLRTLSVEEKPPWARVFKRRPMATKEKANTAAASRRLEFLPQSQSIPQG